MEIISFLFVYFSIFLANAIIMLVLKNLSLKNLNDAGDLIFLIGTFILSGMLSLLYSFHPYLFLIDFFFNIFLILIAKNLFKNYSYSGLNFYIANYLIIIVGLIWGTQFLLSLHISLITKLLLMAATPLIVFTIPSDIIQLVEQYDVVTRNVWNRPKTIFPKRIKSHNPMVSIHVPTHSEPPSLVIETLNLLSKQNYDNFEVIVVDNNTTDPALWMPVKLHCEKLGEKFRFFHVEKLKGAKAGALNFALKHTNPWAKVIGVVDADYHADPDFISALIGYFDDPRIGFVQTPHDYRDWQKNLYLTMCYWEYKIFFHTTMVSLNERDSALTVGTMCLILKKALEDAGGWAKWCVTEDSELAIRIHNAGYSSVYVNETYGKGLIPDTFESYKKQRYRWTAGPVQEFRHHFGLFLGLSKKPSKLTFLQRLFHTNHGFDNVTMGFAIPMNVVGLLVIISMIVHREIINVPFELWLAATIMLVSTPLLTWMMYKSIIKAKFWEIAGQIFASKALSHTIHYSAFRTTLTGNAAWNRTNKFKSKYSYLAALFTTKEELLIGLAITIFIIGAFILFPYSGFTLMFLIGLTYTALNYFTAPIMGIINVYSMKKDLSVETEKVSAPLFKTA